MASVPFFFFSFFYVLFFMSLFFICWRNEVVQARASPSYPHPSHNTADARIRLQHYIPGFCYNAAVINGNIDMRSEACRSSSLCPLAFRERARVGGDSF